MGLELRTGIYGQYYGNTYNSSNTLTQNQMELNATYIWNYLGNQGWTMNAVAGMLRKYAKRKCYKSAVAGKVMSFYRLTLHMRGMD